MRVTRTRWWGICTALMLCVSGVAQALPQGVIVGRVVDVDTGESLFGTNVQIEGTLLGASVRDDGRYIIPRVPPGQFNLRASRIGYAVLVYEVKVMSGDTARVDFALRETAVDVDPVVVTANKGSQILMEASNAISIVTAAEIAERANLRLDDALETVPGVNFMEENINIRGSSGYSRGTGSRVLFLIDGVPSLTSDLGSVNWDLIPVTEVDHIEVVKGAGSALYGSSALGGVINVITRDPAPEGRLSVRMSSGVYDKPYHDAWKWTDRTLHFERYDASYSRQVGSLGLRLALGSHRSTGYEQNGHFVRYNASGKLTYRFSDGSRASIHGAYHHDDRGEFIEWISQNQPYEVANSMLKLRAHINSVNLYAQYWKPFSAVAGIRARVSLITSLLGTHNRNDDFFPGYGPGAEIQGYWIPHSAHSLTFGAEWKLDTGNSQFIGKHRGYTVAPYIQDEWRVLDDLRLTSGVRWDRYELDGGERVDESISPKFGINYNPAPYLTLRGSMGGAFRVASVTERFVEFDFAGFHVESNPELEPETSWSWDVGTRIVSGDGLFLDASWFHSDFWELIEANPDASGTITFRNVTRALVQGIETAMGGSWWNGRLGLKATFTQMWHEDLDDEAPLAYRPRRLVTVTPSVRLGPVELQADYRYASRVEEVKIYFIDKRVPMKVLDLRALYRVGPARFTLALNNALAYHYTLVERNMGEIRNVMGTVSLEL